MITIGLFYCCEKAFTLMNIWLIGKNSIKLHYLKKKLNSHLNMGDINDAGYLHAKTVYKDFEIKKLGEYHDLLVKSDTLLLADVFERF